jgi:hypothetical protein
MVKKIITELNEFDNLYFEIIIQNNELIEIQADRMPIGYPPNEKPSFTNNEIQLKAGDIFYLFLMVLKTSLGVKKALNTKHPTFKIY